MEFLFYSVKLKMQWVLIAGRTSVGGSINVYRNYLTLMERLGDEKYRLIFSEARMISRWIVCGLIKPSLYEQCRSEKYYIQVVTPCEVARN